ncbi:MAG: LEPR-XLL domain-containing protein, partial [Pirellulaceae bacterium]|nr:LEPR-XLL domain-containing protein [Pirellulaceae bacterium]
MSLCAVQDYLFNRDFITMGDWSVKALISWFRNRWQAPKHFRLAHRQESKYQRLKETSLEPRILLSANPIINLDDAGTLVANGGLMAGDGGQDEYHIKLEEHSEGQQIVLVVNDRSFNVGSPDQINSIHLQGSSDDDRLIVDQNIIEHTQVIFDGGLQGNDFDQIFLAQESETTQSNLPTKTDGISYSITGDEVEINLKQTSSEIASGTGGLIAKNVESIIDEISSEDREFSFQDSIDRVTLSEYDVATDGDDSSHREYGEGLLELHSGDAMKIVFRAPNAHLDLDSSDSTDQIFEVNDLGSHSFNMAFVGGQNDQLLLGGQSELVIGNAHFDSGFISFQGNLSAENGLLATAHHCIEVTENAILTINGPSEFIAPKLNFAGSLISESGSVVLQSIDSLRLTGLLDVSSSSSI